MLQQQLLRQFVGPPRAFALPRRGRQKRIAECRDGSVVFHSITLAYARITASLLIVAKTIC
jgi:hypothetical protein